MERAAFLRNCIVGLCSCATSGLGGGEGHAASAADTTLEAVRRRHALLLEVLARHMPPDEMNRVLRDLGRACAREYGAATYEKYAGNLRGFLAAATGPDGWMASTDYDEKAGALTIVDRATTCTCPLVQRDRTPRQQCDCTLGWQEETYARILGRPVRASLVESILRGDRRCVYRVNVLS